MKTRTFVSFVGLGLATLLAQTAGAQNVPPAPGIVPPAAGASGPTTAVAGDGQTPAAIAERVAPTLEGLEPEPGGLTSQEVARRALKVSPSVKQKRAQLTVANEKITQTMLAFFPKLTANAGYTRLSNVVNSFGAFTIPVVLDNWSLEGHLSIPLSDYIFRLVDAAASSKASREAARIGVEAEKLSIANQAQTLYFNWLRARGQVSIAKNSVDRTRARLQDARSAFTVGSISKADLLRIEALVANTELRLNGAESGLALATGQLAITMEDWHPNYRVGEGIPAPESVPEEKASTGQLIAEAQGKRLEVRAVDQAISGYTHGASATRAGALPRLDGFGDAFYANPNQRYFPPQDAWKGTWDLGLRATWSIDGIFSSTAAGRELDADAQATIEQRRLVLAGVAMEVLNASLALSRARAAVDKQHAALAAAEEGYRVTTDLFRAGRATSTDLIESESQLLEAKLGEVNARIDVTVAAIALGHATGRDIPASGPTAQNGG